MLTLGMLVGAVQVIVWVDPKAHCSLPAGLVTEKGAAIGGVVGVGLGKLQTSSALQAGYPLPPCQEQPDGGFAYSQLLAAGVGVIKGAHIAKGGHWKVEGVGVGVG